MFNTYILRHNSTFKVQNTNSIDYPTLHMIPLFYDYLMSSGLDRTSNDDREYLNSMDNSYLPYTELNTNYILPYTYRLLYHLRSIHTEFIVPERSYKKFKCMFKDEVIVKFLLYTLYLIDRRLLMFSLIPDNNDFTIPMFNNNVAYVQYNDFITMVEPYKRDSILLILLSLYR